MRISSIRGKDDPYPMKRTTFARQSAPVAAAARPCASAYGQRWIGSDGVGRMKPMHTNLFASTDTQALGRPPT